MRELEDGGGESIRQSLRPGGILTSQLAVLDDISRAPGEALNVLLRILNERRFCMREGDIEIPLITAIATGNPCHGVDDYNAEPLDLATLDRFTLQVKAQGLIDGESWDEALRVIAMNSGSEQKQSPVQEHDEVDIPQTLRTAHLSLPTVFFGPDLQKLLLDLLKRLRQEIVALKSSQSAAHSSSGGLFTDRTFLAKGPLVCRAHAILQGRSVCIDEDLIAIRHLTAFRLPEQVHACIDEIIEDVIRNARKKDKPSKQEGQGSGGSGGSGVSSGDSGMKGSDRKHDIRDSQDSVPAEGNRLQSQADPPHHEELVENTATSSNLDKVEQRPLEQLQNRLSDSIVIPILASLAVVETYLRRLTGIEIPTPHNDAAAAKLIAQGHVEPLLAAIGGRMRRKARKKNKAILSIGGSGQPRGWRTPYSLQDIGRGDLDEAATAEWVRDPTPRLPQAIARQIGTRGSGRLAIVRDTSASMEGAHTIWASAVVSSLLQMCQRRSISVGYLEFNHEPTPFRGGRRSSDEGNFFSREYESVLNCARQVQNVGGTNMQFALRTVLNEYANAPCAIHDCKVLQELGRELFFGRIQGGRAWASARSHTKLREYGILLPSESDSRSRQRAQSPASHHVLMVTDGIPTFGSSSCAEEREEARAMGLCVHTVFIGDSEEYPRALGALAKATGGVRFQASIDYQTGRVRLLDREWENAAA